MAGINIGGAASITGLQVYFGVLQPPTGSGLVSVSGLGFQPNAILFFSNRYHFQNVQLVDAVATVGFATADGQQVQCWSEERGAGPPTHCIRYVTDDLVYIEILPNSPDLITGTISLDSFDADGFTVDAQEPAGPITWDYIHYLALKCPTARSQIETLPATGTDTFTLPNDPSVVLGFRYATGEDNLMTLDSRLAFGWATATDQAAVGGYSEDSATDRTASEVLQDDRFLSIPGASGGSDGSWEVSDFGAALEVTNIDGGTSDIGLLSLGGIRAAAGSGTTATTGTNVSDAITGLGFSPKAVIITSVSEEANASVDGTTQKMLFGVAATNPADSPPVQELMWFGGTPDPGTDDCGIYSSPNFVFSGRNDLTGSSGNRNTMGSFVSFDSDGFTLEWVGPPPAFFTIGGSSPPAPAFHYTWLALG